MGQDSTPQIPTIQVNFSDVGVSSTNKFEIYQCIEDLMQTMGSTSHNESHGYTTREDLFKTLFFIITSVNSQCEFHHQSLVDHRLTKIYSTNAHIGVLWSISSLFTTHDELRERMSDQLDQWLVISGTSFSMNDRRDLKFQVKLALGGAINELLSWR